MMEWVQIEKRDYWLGFETLSHAKRYLDDRNRLDLDSERLLLQAHRDIMDAVEANAANQYLENGKLPDVPNEHNLHSAAKVAAGVIILLMLGWWLFWLKASQ